VYHARFSACEICEWVRNYVTLLNCMVLVKYALRTGLFGEYNIAGEITNYLLFIDLAIDVHDILASN